jgi:hypothetical protein
MSIDRSGLQVNPNLFFSTAAGPNAVDIYGPPPDVLDIWSNGVPVASSQEATANMGGGIADFCPPWRRRDVHGLMFLLIGGFMIWLHNR